MESRFKVMCAAFAGAAFMGLIVYQPAALAISSVAQVVCSSNTSACAGWANMLGGAALTANSQSGNAVLAWTHQTSATSHVGKSAVIGQDAATDGGVLNIGVTGKSFSGTGTYGVSTSGVGSYGSSMTGNGVFAGLGVSYPPGTVRNAGEAALAVDYTSSSSNTALFAESDHGFGVIAVSSGGTGGPAAMVTEANNGASLFQGWGSGGSAVTIDGEANIDTTGELTTSGGCASGCTRRRHQRSYASTAAQPTLEDTGEAQLFNGVAMVRLDPALANAIDPQQGYYVLITPEGDTRGLYVANRTPAGFIVRETMGGRSSIAFAYRVVAHPYGVHAPRLPLTTAAEVKFHNR